MVRNRTNTVRARQRMLRRGLAAFYALSGAGKLAGASWAVALFEALAGGTAAGRELRLVTGGLELTGAVLLVLPALAGAGALVLSCVMTGALVAHVTVLRMSPAVPVVLLALLVPLAWRGRADVARLLRPAPRPAVRRRRRVSGLTTADRRHSGWPGGRASGAAGRV